MTHPLLDLIVLQERARQRLVRPNLGWRNAGVPIADWFVQSIAIYTALGLILLGLAVLVLHARRVGWIGAKRGPSRGLAESRPSCGDRPMLSKNATPRDIVSDPGARSPC
ncbi:MAG: hypothetical protein U0800_04675 [Isosphaeraceae bacterium]